MTRLRRALALARWAPSHPRIAILGAIAGVEEARSWAAFEAEQAEWLRTTASDPSPAHRAVAAEAIAQVCKEVRNAHLPDAAAVAARRRRAN